MNRRILIRIVIALAGLWIILLCLVYISGKKYSDHVLSILKTQIDKYLLTEIQIRKDNIHVSLLKKFPYAVVELNDVLVKSSQDFSRADFRNESSDTLFFASALSLMFDLKSLLSKTYILKKIEIHDAMLNLFSDKKGRYNYNIIRKGEGNKTQDTLNFDIKNISIRNLLFQYNNQKTSVILSGGIQKAHLSGNFRQSEFQLNCRLTARETSLGAAGKQIWTKESLSLTCDIREKESLYTFTEGHIILFGIRMNAGGKYNSLKNEYDFSLDCKSAPFQKLDNNWVTRYLGDTGLKPSGGDIDVLFRVSGKNSATPLLKLNFLIRNGVLKHRESRIKVEDIYARGYYTNSIQKDTGPGLFQLDSLFFKSGNTGLYLSGSVRNFSRPAIKGKIKGNLELSKLNIFRPVNRKMKTGGDISLHVTLNGTIPHVENIRTKGLKNFSLQGFVILDKANIQAVDNTFPASVISGKINLKDLSEIYLENIQVQTGNSDLQLNGSVSQLPFFSSNRSEFPVYRCSVVSEVFNVEDFFLPSTNKGDTVLVQFPDSVIVYSDFNIGSFAFGKFQAGNVSGRLAYRPKKIMIEDFAMQSQGGTIQSDISLVQTGETITANAEARFQHVDISDLFYAFNEFGQSVLTHEYINGALTGFADVSALWDNHLNPLYDKLSVRSKFIIEKGELINYQPLLGLSDYIEVEELKHIKFDDLHGSVNVTDKKVVIDQTQVNSSAIWLLVSGEHDFENRYAYRIQVHLADVLWKKAKKRRQNDTEFGYIRDDEHQRTILPLVITGQDTVFKVSYDKETGGLIFRNKVRQEHQVWKELVSPDSIVHPENENFRVEWNEENEDPANTPSNDDSIDEEFRIEWDDE